MGIFERMRAFRALASQHIPALKTELDRHLISEIGYHQAKGGPVSLNQLFLLNIGSIATIQRHLRRLEELGAVQHWRAASDRRTVELTLSPKCVRIFTKFESLIRSNAAAPGSDGPRYLCGLCDNDAAKRNLLVTFLARGLKRGDKCLLVAPAEGAAEILAAMPDRRKAPRHLLVSEGFDSADAQFEFLKRVSREAKQAGQTMRLAADMSWSLPRNLRIDALMDVEARLDALAAKSPFAGLCVYDARHFSSADFLRAVKCHRDHLHYPIVLG